MISVSVLISILVPYPDLFLEPDAEKIHQHDIQTDVCPYYNFKHFFDCVRKVPDPIDLKIHLGTPRRSAVNTRK
jgi:hypothetical protein